MLSVPLIAGGDAIGTISIRRTEVRPFTDRQIELLKTFADQAVIAIENTRLLEEVQARTRDATEALEYQTATSDVLEAISRSPTDAQPVFNMIAKSAARLCAAQYCHVFRFDGELIHFVASHGHSAEALKATPTQGNYPMHPGRGTAAGRAIASGSIEEISDVHEDPEYLHGDIATILNISGIVAVPMLKDSRPIGAIVIARSQAGRFPVRQIELLRTFADQAVIAIENTRLFEAEQASKRELTESLEQQTATNDVLVAVSRSFGGLQKLQEQISETAARLCRADYAVFFTLRDGRYHVSSSNKMASPFVTLLISNPSGPGRETCVGRAALEQQVIHIPDGLADIELAGNPVALARQRVSGVRTVLGVPILRNGLTVAVIFLARISVDPFSNRQISLVKTLADQALIAIENARLFEAEQASKRELQESLKYQTATTEVLDVISRSPTNSQPVLDTIAASIRRLSGSTHGSVFLFDGKQIHLAAHAGMDPAAAQALAQSFPQVPGRGGATARALLSRQVAYIPDVLADDEYRVTDVAKAVGYRSIVSVPMLREGHPLGAITASAAEPAEFSARQIALLQTFANQAVIAINNAGLFEEVQARNRDLTALGEVGRAVSSTLDLKVVLKTVVERAVDLSGTDAGSIFYYREETGRFELGETMGLDEDTIARLRKLDIPARDSGLGEAIAQRKPLLIPDLTKRESNPLRAATIEAGVRAALIVPLLSSDGPLGTLVLQRRKPGEFPEAIVSLMQSFADQSAIALENARLYNEIAQKSRELEIASQHKSQFVANMSHELRTPLAAILGYAELMQEGFYEPLGQKSLDALTRIRSNGKHLLGLINTVLDIAKIESGQFTLNMTEYAIESVVETVRAATESLAQNKKLTLRTAVDKPLPVGLGDEQRLTQVLLNLVGNAIKFTDAGEVSIAAGARNGHFSVSVTDTGPGIPLDQQDRIFDQFHQVDSSLTKAKGGTGLGLAIAKQIVEMHGGRIWVESTPGKGATFQMEIPTRAEARKIAP
jgi:GAF domain-containing protein/anti-sigma regulatory factor (Ser/Thr protein kinase)